MTPNKWFSPRVVGQTVLLCIYPWNVLHQLLKWSEVTCDTLLVGDKLHHLCPKQSKTQYFCPSYEELDRLRNWVSEKLS
jgi:hypothetical protein